MLILSQLFTGALFLGLFLSANDKDAVPIPKSEWNDDVGKSIRQQFDVGLTKFNVSYEDCSNVISNLKNNQYKLESGVEFKSKEQEIYDIVKKFNDIKITDIEDEVNSVLRG